MASEVDMFMEIILWQNKKHYTSQCEVKLPEYAPRINLTVVGEPEFVARVKEMPRSRRRALVSGVNAFCSAMRWSNEDALED
jgi:hypothetical protein